MNLEPSPPEKTTPTAAEAMQQQPVSAEKKCCVFYKLIVKSIIQQKELAIPNKFSRKFGDKLSDVVTLTDSNLTKWKIGLRRLNHRLWFHHGWPKFVEDHSIHAGSFLIFKYEENSNFAVNLYELVASEVKSPSDNAGPSSEPAQPEQIEVARFDADELIETHPNSKGESIISELDGFTKKTKPGLDVHDKKASFLKWKRRSRAVTNEERRCAVLAAENFKSDLPSCRITMRVSYVYYSFDLKIPSEFSKKYLKDMQGVIQLQDPNGRKWPVRCFNKGNKARLNTGWRDFVVENNLDDGDICIFELVQRDDIVLKVYIFRAANPEVVQASSEPMPKSSASSRKWKRIPRTVTDEEKRRAVHEAANFTSQFPFCHMVMHPSYVYSNFNLFLPAGFSNKYLLDLRGPITLQDSNGRKWPARCWYRKNSAIITTGWREFVVDNNLHGGDVCIFELVQMEDDIVVLKVSIFRAAAIPDEEIVQVSSESVPQQTEEDEQQVNIGQSIDIEDNANDFMEKVNNDVYAETGIGIDAQPERIEVASIRSPQSKDIYQSVMLPSPSKTPKGKSFVEYGAEKTSSVVADSIVRPVLEMRDEHAPKTGTEVDTDELDGFANKTKPAMDAHDKKASFLKWKRRPRAVTDEERRCAVLAAENFKSDLPFCRIMMRVSYVYYKFDLSLPSKFSNKYLKDVQGVIQLQDPNGKKWPVRCRFNGNGARLNTGWRGFVVENNLDDGDVCIFELVQRDDIVLKVYIFRASSESMPKSTPSMFVDNIASERREHEDDANDFMEILDEDIDNIVPQYSDPGCSKDNSRFAECMAEKTSSNVDDSVGWLPFEIRDKPVHEAGSKVMETRKEINNLYPKLPNSIWKRRLISELGDFRNKKKAKMEARNKASSLKWKGRARTVTDEEKRQAVHAAANFTSKFPFCRMVMQPSYVYYNFKLFLPSGFSKKYLLGKQGPITLQNSNGRKWSAQCRFKKSTTTAIITTGWHDFVVDNNLNGGDVCIFELVQVEEDTVVLKVSIFRAATIPEEEMGQLYGKSIPEKIEGSKQEVNPEKIKATSIRPPQSKDIFQTVILPSPSKNTKDKPFAEFCAEKTSSVTADSIVKPVLETQPNSKCKRKLISEQDGCHDKKKPRVEVHDKKTPFLKWVRTPRAITDEERKWVVLAAKNFKSDLPFCRIMMRVSHVYYRFELNFPSEFSKKHLKDVQGVIELQDPSGRKWLVQCSYKDNRGRATVTTGWRGFVVDNNLDDGDVCIFELVRRDDTVLKVSIFRAAKPSMAVDNIASEDYANDFMEILNEDTDINMPQYSAPGCSKDNSRFPEFMAEKTSSNIDETRHKPVQETGIEVIETQREIKNLYSKLPDSIWKRRLISELGDCCNKEKAKMEVCNKASSLKWKGIAKTVSDEEKRQAIHAAANFTSEFPYCRMVMQPSYVSSKFQLFLPAGFSKKYLPGMQKSITLEDSNGRKWPAWCWYRKSRAVITKGWREFVVDNNLDDGDVCTFELVQKEEDMAVLKVSIFRAAAIPEEEIVRVSGESVPQRIDIDDNANDLMEKLNKDVYEPARAEQIEVNSIRSPQSKDIYQTVMLPSPSKTPKGKSFVECGAEKTFSVTADSIVKPVLEMRGEPAPKIGICELDDCRDKKKLEMEVHDKKASFFKWNRRPRRVTYEERRRAFLAAENFKSDLPFCRIMMQMSDIYELCLPAEFSNNHLKDIEGVIELQDPNGRKWPVWCCYMNNRSKVTAGWHAFMTEHKLDDGDVCIFELVQTDGIVLKVSIFRAANPEELVQVSSESMPQNVPATVDDDIALEEREEEINNLSLANQHKLTSELDDSCNKKKAKMEVRDKASNLKWKRIPRIVTDEEKRRAVHAAANFTSKFPFCRMVMQPSYVYSHFSLFLPAGFSKKYMLGIRGPITLQDSNGRKWPAQCRYRRSTAIISAGWRKFVEDNNLDDGDVCIFELVQVENDIMVMKVSIFRATAIPEEEIVRVYGESVTQKIEGSEQEVNLDQCIDIEDYANNCMEKSDEDVYGEMATREDAQQEANKFDLTDQPDNERKRRLASELDECCNKKKAKMEERTEQSSLRWIRRSRAVTDEERRLAVDAAAKFTSKFPFFQRVMSPSYVYYNFTLYIPAYFSKKHLKDIRVIMLRDPSGREWLAPCNYSDYTAKICKGWGKFVVDNNLHDGDICIFELVQKEEDTVVLKVSIFRAAKPE